LFGTGAVVATWSAPGAGSWFDSNNWTGGIPNTIGAEARFLGAIAATSTVYADTPVTVGTMRFNNASSTYHVTGAGTLTLQVNSGSALVNVQAGTHKINLPLIIASDTDLSVAAGASLKISDPVTVNAGKNVTQSGTGTVLYESTVDVQSGGSIAFGNSSHMAGLTLASGATAQITPGANKALNVDSLSVSAGKVNIQDNKLITKNALGSATSGVYNGVSGLIQSGRNGGSWTGNGIITTQSNATAGNNFTSIGVATAQQVKNLANASDTALWAGQTVTGSDTLVMYTYGGDANLDGKVTISDYGKIDFAIGIPGANGWFNGDFNYDGKVTISDYGIIDFTIGIQGPPFPTSLGMPPSGTSAVPEPAGIVSLGTIALSCLPCRRRRAASRRGRSTGNL
jgi:hypothetical protein